MYSTARAPSSAFRSSEPTATGRAYLDRISGFDRKVRRGAKCLDCARRTYDACATGCSGMSAGHAERRNAAAVCEQGAR